MRKRPGATSSLQLPDRPASLLNGIHPEAGLALGPDGNFYGTTRDGGSNNLGTIFKITPSGALTSVLSFNGTNGSAPQGGLVLARDGILYGTTVMGGQNSFGTVFRFSTNGTLTSLASFSATNGANPQCQLVLDGSGNFYGTAPEQGANFSGTVFKVQTNGVLATLVQFDDSNGSSPEDGLAARLNFGLIELHSNFAVKNFEQWAVPVLDDVVMGGKALVDEGAQVLTDCFASVPISHAQVAHCFLGKAVKTLAEARKSRIPKLAQREFGLTRQKFSLVRTILTLSAHLVQPSARLSLSSGRNLKRSVLHGSMQRVEFLQTRIERFHSMGCRAMPIGHIGSREWNYDICATL